MDTLSPAALGVPALIAGGIGEVLALCLYPALLLALCSAIGAWLARRRGATTREIEPPELVSFRARYAHARAGGTARRPAPASDETAGSRHRRADATHRGAAR